MDLLRMHHLLVPPPLVGSSQSTSDRQISRHLVRVHERHESKLVRVEELRPFLFLLSDRQLEEEEGRVCVLYLFHFQRYDKNHQTLRHPFLLLLLLECVLMFFKSYASKVGNVYCWPTHLVKSSMRSLCTLLGNPRISRQTSRCTSLDRS